MGKLTEIGLAIIFTFALIGIFVTGIQSQDAELAAKPFVQRVQYDNSTASLITSNGTVINISNQSSVSNFQTISDNMREQIASAQRTFSNDDPNPVFNIASKLAAAFGLLTALTMNVLYLVLALISEGINLVFGIGSNLRTCTGIETTACLPAPWSFIGDVLIPVILTALLFYMVMLLVRAYKIGDTI